MKTTKWILAGLSVAVLALSSHVALAGDDPSIKGKLRKSIGKAMKTHIAQNTLDGKYVIYDAVSGHLKTLRLAELHAGIVKKGDFFVSCADFLDPSGTKYDVDFLVGGATGSHKVLEAVVHSIDGKKRTYHLEDSAMTKKMSDKKKIADK